MKLVLHAHQVDLPRDMAAFVTKHLVRPLQRLHDSPADQLTVKFEDSLPGRRGPQDQLCKVTFRMPGSAAIQVEAAADDLHASLLDCAQRLRRLVQRQLEKARAPSRSPMHKPLGRTWRRVASRRELAPDGTPSTL